MANHVNNPRGAVQALAFVWDIPTLKWIPETQPGSGGGGGGTSSVFGAAFPASGTASGFKDTGGNMAPGLLDAAGFIKVNVAAGGAGGGAVTVADGADVTQGAKADAAGTTTVVGQLKSVKLNTDNLDVALSTRLKPADTLTKVATVDTITNAVTVQQATAANLKVDLSGTGANATAIKVDGSAVTQPVSGTVTVQQATAANLKVDLSGTGANATAIKVDGSAVTQPVSAVALPLPTGAATSANQTTEIASLANLDVALSTRLKPADTLTKVTTVDTITNPVAITVASLPLPANAAIESGGNLANLLQLQTELQQEILIELRRQNSILVYMMDDDTPLQLDPFTLTGFN